MRHIGALAIVLALAACGGDDESLDTTELRDRIVEQTEDLEFDEFQSAEVDCIFDDPGDVLSSLFDGLLGADAVDPTEVEDEGSAYQLVVNDSVLLGCFATEESDGLGLDVAVAPASIESYAQEFYDPDDESEGIEIGVDDTGSALGGTTYEVTVSDAEDPAFESREVIWVDDDVMVMVYRYGPNADDVDLDELRTRLVDQLPTIVESALT